MKSPRRSLAIALVALSPLVLAGCEKPYPGVTVWSGTSSEHVEALCWQPKEIGGLTPKECAQDVRDAAGSGQGITALEVAPGSGHTVWLVLPERAVGAFLARYVHAPEQVAA